MFVILILFSDLPDDKGCVYHSLLHELKGEIYRASGEYFILKLENKDKWDELYNRISGVIDALPFEHVGFYLTKPIDGQGNTENVFSPQ